MNDSVSSNDQLCELKKYHAEIVEADGAECEAMRLTRWGIEEIERLREQLDTANANHERFDREWYLRGDEIEKLIAERDQYKQIAALNAETIKAMQQHSPMAYRIVT